MKIENLKKISELVGIEISDSLNAVGTPEMYELCLIQDRLRRIIQIKEQPDKINKIYKSMILGVKSVQSKYK